MDNKIKVNELAKKINASSKRVMEILNEINIFPKSTMSTLEEDELKAFYAHTGFNPDKEKPQAPKASEKASAEGNKASAAAPKMTGTVIKRIVRSTSSDDYYNNEADDKAKKNARQSTVASSGLRSGYVTRSEVSDAPEKAKPATQEVVAKPAVSTSDAPKIVRRVKKVDLQPKAEEPTKEIPKEETPWEDISLGL